MSTDNTPGNDLQGGDDDARRAAAALMGKSRTDKKIAAARINVARATDTLRGVPISEEHKAKLKVAQKERREREKQERAALSPDTAPEPKRPRGRPSKQKEPINEQP